MCAEELTAITRFYLGVQPCRHQRDNSTVPVRSPQQAAYSGAFFIWSRGEH